MIQRTRYLDRLIPPLALIAMTASCDGGPTGLVSQNFTFAFDIDLEGWTVHGTDLTDPPVTWSIEQSEDQALVGTGAARFVLNNINDAGKIWLQRELNLDPLTTYTVDVDYAFGTMDEGDVNLWTIITGVHLFEPREATDLTLQGDTGNGGGAGLRWVRKSHTFTVTTDPTGKLYVTIGVWGTYEVERTYFVDDVHFDIRQS